MGNIFRIEESEILDDGAVQLTRGGRNQQDVWQGDAKVHARLCRRQSDYAPQPLGCKTAD